MKKSELASFIKEEILSTLDEDKQTQQDIKDTEELTKATAELAKAKEEAGIEEDATPKGEDFFYDYLDIGMSYLEGFGKKHSLDDNQLEKLGKKIVDQLYKGDVGKAYDAIVKRGAMNEEAKVRVDDLQDIGYDDGEYAFDKHFNKSILNNRLDTKYYSRGFVQAIIDNAGSLNLNENEDKEPSKADLKKTKGLAKAKEELAQLTKQMKSLARKYKEAEGEEKEKLVADLKKKTKLKKELEAIIDK